MANYTAASAKHPTLAAGTIDTVTLNAAGDFAGWRLQNCGSDDIFYRWGTTTDSGAQARSDGIGHDGAPSQTGLTVKGDNTYRLRPGATDEIPLGLDNEASLIVALISASAVDYSVEAW